MNSQWQPIETAPKDGDCFIGLDYRGGAMGIYSICVYYDGRIECADDGEPRKNLTHWMPLPEPPK